jgi:hypothetical protein
MECPHIRIWQDPLDGQGYLRCTLLQKWLPSECLSKKECPDYVAIGDVEGVLPE